jgi:hypothetical protein
MIEIKDIARMSLPPEGTFFGRAKYGIALVASKRYAVV